MQQNSVIHVEDLTMAYRETPVLWDIDLDIPEHVRCAIVGPNGAGKSTLLRGILGLLKPVSGAVQLWGKPLSAVHKQIAYVPQRGSVHWDFPTTVFDVVLMGRYAHLGLVRRPGKEDRALAMEALDKMKMADFA
ncbi:MAG: metal ABC transporter ATP-binding protein, partial [Selenomonas massiliensis]